jgi:hypothetical protein
MLHTINARQIARLNTVGAPITSLTFHEREYSHLDILATGHNDGSITLWTWNADGTPAEMQAQWEFVEVRRMDSGQGTSDVTLGSVTALKFIGYADGSCSKSQESVLTEISLVNAFAPVTLLD